MRLGTRSCAECRRRKIRCVFPEEASTCEACNLHGVSCNPQQPRRNEERPPKSVGNDALKRRLDEMEAIVRRIYSAVDVNGNSPPLTQAHGHPVALGQYSQHQDSSVSSTSYSTSPRSSSHALGASETSDAQDTLGEFGNTPLFTLFKESLLLHGKPATPPRPQHGHSTRHLFREIPSIIPPNHVLKQILETSRRCWGIWPPCFHGSERLQDMEVSDMHHFMLMAFNSDDTSVAAKALLWMALCIFELPLSWTRQRPELSKPDTMISALSHHARRLLATSMERGDTMDSIEALALEIKLSVDLGKPRRAWLGARQVVNAALLLGIPRMKSAESGREQDIWRTVLLWERETSLLMGLPSSISSSSKSLLPDPDGLLPLDRLMRDMAIVAGAVADRNQTDVENNYSKTIELDHEWERMKDVMPHDFWHAEPPSGLSFHELYFRQTLKIQFFMIGKLVHLPYLVRSATKQKFLLSRTACLNASRDLVTSYLYLRSGVDPEQAPCGLMDFAGFSAGVVVAIHLLQEAAKGSRAVEDQELLVELLGSLRQVATLKECTVAGQAAEVLGKLVAVVRRDASRERWDAEEGCDVMIPFLGRLRIKVPNLAGDVAVSSSLAAPRLESEPFLTLPVVEFGATLSDSDMFANFNMDEELAADWSTSFEAGGYDWVTVFQQDQMDVL